MVFAVYLATFSRRTSLPSTLDPVFWLPVLPVESEEGSRDLYEPLPSINGVPQWVSLRRCILIVGSKVNIIYLFSMNTDDIVPFRQVTRYTKRFAEEDVRTIKEHLASTNGGTRVKLGYVER